MNTAKTKKEPAKFDTFSDTIFNSLPGNTVVINEQGKIIKVNQNWNNFAVENGMEPNFNWLGQNYLDVCKKITGISDELAGVACKAIKGILRGEESDFELQYPCNSPSAERWFNMLAKTWNKQLYPACGFRWIKSTIILELNLKIS